ncbi:50S ribosomal protein L22 [Trueperella pyogenes]|uniref:Large ribosomal subunit protein uL22 n=1 Tax=Trueperella pyogenes TaxID=1661 RepID=X4R9E5_9ACTO|nr:50S ribosomal protein L22 [Trueperella pyogenes]AHU89409.1 50S ribosomal protein L22 [Trueperella pyogenes]AJC69198.1 50S ribosomal protein L22 [Trueperella pyogenes TP8]ALD73873.1 50S ribosomal protein L22 [Trueperella pyogenes]AWA43373.1 50S ribosomal protein L22 [Trueperella pyogenes]AWG04186.1 50S ribosomal protein L22 [Trueperella pyogenes]
MEAKAQARFVRVTPQKARRVINEIRGMNAANAVDMLKFAPQAVARDILKIVSSAIANARYVAGQNGEKFDESALEIRAAYVDEGPTMKRIQPRAQGRANRIMKRTSHITVIVGTKEA